MKTFKKDELTVNVYETRTLMGEAAAKDIKNKIKELLLKKAEKVKNVPWTFLCKKERSNFLYLRRRAPSKRLP